MFGFVSRLKERVPKETFLGRLSIWSRRTSFVLLGVAPVLLIYQLAQWTEVRYWSDISFGAMIYPDREIARALSRGRWRVFTDMLWIPLWLECIVAAIFLFALHILLWNRIDMARQTRRRARRVQSGTSRGGPSHRSAQRRRPQSRTELDEE